MTVRSRRPTDEVGAAVFEPAGRARLEPPPLTVEAASPASRGTFESFEQATTDVTARPDAMVDAQAAAVAVEPLAMLDPPPAEPGAPVAPMRAAGPSEPVRVISMKEHPELQRPPPEELAAPLHVQLRSIAEVARRGRDTPVGLGNLAPPRNARQARARRLLGNVGWACVAIALAGAITLAIWFVAGV